METWVNIKKEWYHIVIVVDVDIKKTYINGELFSTEKVNETHYEKFFTQPEIQEMYNKGIGQNASC